MKSDGKHGKKGIDWLDVLNQDANALSHLANQVKM